MCFCNTKIYIYHFIVFKIRMSCNVCLVVPPDIVKSIVCLKINGMSYSK